MIQGLGHLFVQFACAPWTFNPIWTTSQGPPDPSECQGHEWPHAQMMSYAQIQFLLSPSNMPEAVSSAQLSAADGMALI